MTTSPPQTTSLLIGESPEDSAAKQQLVVGVVKEGRRVALTPESVTALRVAGLDVVIETGAGAGAWFSDDAYAEAGAEIVSSDEVIPRSDVLLMVGRPSTDLISALRTSHTVIGMLQPLVEPGLARPLGDRGVTAVSLDGLPRTLRR